jgi:GTP:adenosylcobinamide-phosphate guanylyltransferase
MHAIILAGDRPGGSPLAKSNNVSSGIFVKVNGVPCINRVLIAVQNSLTITSATIVGPSKVNLLGESLLTDLLKAYGFDWLSPEKGPAASAIKGLKHVNTLPILLTTGDHALLTSTIIDEFCKSAKAVHGDFVVGLVPYADVIKAFPDTKRTLLRFADGIYCGCNLFLLKTIESQSVLDFWKNVELDRKKPWRIVMKIGPTLLLKYFFRLLTISELFEKLSACSGAQVRHVSIANPIAAIDVDSESDLKLANEICKND